MRIASTASLLCILSASLLLAACGGGSGSGGSIAGLPVVGTGTTPTTPAAPDTGTAVVKSCAP